MRIRAVWLWRLALLGFAVAYLASPTLRGAIPPLVPFLGAAAVEAQFFIQGLRGEPGRHGVTDAGPQPRDLEELGWESPEEGPAPDEHRGRLLLAVTILAVFGAAVFLDFRGQHWQHLSKSTRAETVAFLEQQASRIAGHPATVICDTSGRHVGYVQDADGLAEVGGRRAWLTPQVCYRLYRVRHTRDADSSSGQAIVVLAHEAWHLHGERSEARANCFAYQSGVAVGEALGLSPSTARSLMHEQLADNPSDFASTPAYIVPPGCHRGGALDLHLNDDHFP
jgi:hypothetical protein